MSDDAATDVNLLIEKFRRGDKDAAGRLMELLYPDLKRIARGYMNREEPDHTWQPTVLVNELFMELVKVRELEAPAGETRKEKEAFLGFASHVMQRLLVNHARRLYRRSEKVDLDSAASELPGASDLADSLHRVQTLLGRLESINPRLRQVVELRVFEGLSGDEIATRLGCTRRTVVRDWAFARKMLASELDLPRPTA